MKYVCNKCHEIIERDGKTNGQGKLVNKPPRWMKSFCTTLGENARLSRLDSTKKMIFWRYDIFPYVLCGEGYIKKDGIAYVPSYQGNFVPIQTMSLEEGKKIKNQLALLAHERDSQLQQVNEAFNKKLKKLLPWKDF